MPSGALLLYNRYKSALPGPYYLCQSRAGKFFTRKMETDCASCTENVTFDKTEKIKKKIRSFF